MCGRFTVTIEMEVILNRFGVLKGHFEWHPRYNVAPSQESLTVIEKEQERYMAKMKWGLIPHWSREKKTKYPLINARGDKVRSNVFFRDSFQHRRCLVPADSFFEWKKEGTNKVPYRVVLKDEQLFAFAGLWDVWEGEDGEKVETFTIVTTEANALVAQFHDRMPVILSREGESVWMNEEEKDVSRLEQLMKPYPAGEMKVYEVSSVVNSWKVDSRECINPKGKG